MYIVDMNACTTGMLVSRTFRSVQCRSIFRLPVLRVMFCTHTGISNVLGRLANDLQPKLDEPRYCGIDAGQVGMSGIDKGGDDGDDETSQRSARRSDALDPKLGSR